MLVLHHAKDVGHRLSDDVTETFAVRAFDDGAESYEEAVLGFPVGLAEALFGVGNDRL